MNKKYMYLWKCIQNFKIKYIFDYETFDIKNLNFLMSYFLIYEYNNLARKNFDCREFNNTAVAFIWSARQV